MSTADWIIVAAVILGPVAAVIITLWHQDRKQKRDQKLVILRHVMAFRQLPGDANFSHAINMVPLEFADEPMVLKAHREFIQAASVTATDGNTEVSENTAIKQTRLIFEIAHSLGFNIRETDLQTEGYTASGFAERDRIFLDAHKAWRDIAHLLFIQARQAAEHPLSEQELQFLGIGSEEVEEDPEGSNA